LGFTDISIVAKMAIGASRCCQNAVIFLTHANNLREKTQRTKSKLCCSNTSRCVFYKQADKMKHGACVGCRSRKKA